MINLLPPEEKELLLLERRKNLIVILWFFALFFVLCFILILFSMRFYLQGQLEYQEIILQETKKMTEQSEIKVLQEKFNLFNNSLTQLNSFYQQKIYFSPILEEFSTILPQNAYLTNVSAVILTQAEKEKTESIKVSLSGFISTRESLYEFRKTLGGEKNIAEVSFPPTNWISPADINFFVTFKIIR